MSKDLPRDIAVLFARVVVGVIFIAHGWQKLVTNGLDGTTAFFRSSNIPAPQVSAYFATFVELVGGAALVIGLAVPVAGVLLFVNMFGAFIFVHRDGGLFVSGGGWELVGALGAASLLIAAVGSGAFGVDRLLRGRVLGKRSSRAAA